MNKYYISFSAKHFDYATEYFTCILKAKDCEKAINKLKVKACLNDYTIIKIMEISLIED